VVMEITDDQIRAEAKACDLRKLEQARRMTPEDLFFSGVELFEDACQITLAGIAADFPDDTRSFHLNELKRFLKMSR